MIRENDLNQFPNLYLIFPCLLFEFAKIFVKFIQFE